MIKEKLADWDGEDYAKNSTAQKAFGKTYLPQMALKGYESVLDIGCGDGALTALIAEAVPDGNAVGVDYSDSMISTAAERYGNVAPNISFRVLEALQLDYVDRFHIVFSASALHWITDHIRALERMHKTLRPGGRLFLLFGAKGTAAGVLKVLGRLMTANRWAPYFEGFTSPFGFHSAQEYETLLARTGFRARRVETVPRDMIHPGRMGLEGWLRTTWTAYLVRVPAESRAVLLKELLDEYLAENPLDDQGNAHVSMISLVVEADKI